MFPVLKRISILRWLSVYGKRSANLGVWWAIYVCGKLGVLIQHSLLVGTVLWRDIHCWVGWQDKLKPDRELRS
jgi:hypothetical protein